MASHTDSKYFLLTPPKLTENQFETDVVVRSLLKRFVDKETLSRMEPDLLRFGGRVIGDVQELAERASDPDNEPKLVHHNGWGHRVDQIKTCLEWKQLHDVACTEGLVAYGYTNKFGAFSRLHQFIKLYYFSPVSAIVNCPLAMTDGAARLLTQLKFSGTKLDPRLEEALRRLTSTDPKEFWSSGQWMTERTGGSDVGNSETIARRDLSSSNPNDYLLTGYKFFTSATTADISFLLARIEDSKGQTVKGSKGLSLFFTKVRNADGSMNNIRVHRLKQKFGTKPLPTAELELLNTKAVLVGEIGEGVKTISHLFNLSRLYTPVSHAGGMRRMLNLMKDYAKKRNVFGKPLSEQPLHIATLTHLEVVYRGVTHLSVHMAIILGKLEYAQINPKSIGKEELTRLSTLYRFLTPIGKLYSAKQSVAFMAEAIESFGGTGYMTDTGIPQSLANVVVDTIWEGTTNVLSLDLLRALGHHPESLSIFAQAVEERINEKNLLLPLVDSVRIIRSGLDSVHSFVAYIRTRPLIFSEERARLFSFTLARIYIASLLVDHARVTEDEQDIYTARHWCETERISLLPHILSLGDEEVIATRQLQKKMLFPSKL